MKPAPKNESGKTVAVLIRDRMMGLADMLKDIKKTLRVKKMDAVALESISPGILPTEIPPETFTEEPSPTNVEKTTSAIVGAFKMLTKDLFVSLHDRVTSVIARYQYWFEMRNVNLATRTVNALFKLKEIIEANNVTHDATENFKRCLAEFDRVIDENYSDDLLKTYFADTPLRRYLDKVAETVGNGEYFEELIKKFATANERLRGMGETVHSLGMNVPATADVMGEFHLPNCYKLDEVAQAVELLVERLKSTDQQKNSDFTVRAITTMPIGVDFLNRVQNHRDKMNELLHASEDLSKSVGNIDPSLVDVDEILRIHDSLLANVEFLHHYDQTMATVAKSLNDTCDSIKNNGYNAVQAALEAYYVVVGTLGANGTDELATLKKELDELSIILEYYSKNDWIGV